ncbi:MAG: energy-coupling factor transporter transmembrane component T family protein [Candidatus Thorarchaeota archaeon]|jgi:cobalt/nickel transport system permease protein
MGKFLLPFQEGRSRPGFFSPPAMVVSAIIFGGIISYLADVIMILWMIIIIIVTGLASRTSWRKVIPLAAKLEVFVLFLVVIEPFLYGSTIILTIQSPFGLLNLYSEGLNLGILLGLRMVALILLFLITLSHMTLSGFIGALGTLRIPVVILGSLLIMLRYVPLFLEERNRLQDAQSLRGFERGKKWQRIVSLGNLVGSTIDRAMTRSVSVYESMTLRGFGRGMFVAGAGFRRKDVFLPIILVLLAAYLYNLYPLLLEMILQ